MSKHYGQLELVKNKYKMVLTLKPRCVFMGNYLFTYKDHFFFNVMQQRVSKRVYNLNISFKLYYLSAKVLICISTNHA